MSRWTTTSGCGCTRARDYLVVSLHRKTRATAPAEDRSYTNAELLAQACADAPAQVALAQPADQVADLVPRPQPVHPPPAHQDWRETITQVRTRAARPAAVSASQLEGSPGTTEAHAAAADRLGEPTDPGPAKDARDLELPPSNKGRYGTAVGRAVHGVPFPTPRPTRRRWTG